jgi:single-strand DNA-binding protein
MSARSLNKVMLIGNLTRDPNLRYTGNNTAVCSFGLATNRTWVPTDGGDRQERVDYHSIVAWSKLADICGQLLHKGDKVYVEGRLQTRDWKADDGTERKATEVVIDNMILLRSGNQQGGYQGSDDYGQSDDSSSSSAGGSKKLAGKSSSSKSTQSDDDDLTDDIPF